MTQLSPEMSFRLKSFEYQVQKMSLEQAQEMLMALFRLHLVSEATYKDMLKAQWMGERSLGG